MSILNPRWFPTSLQERAPWYDNFETQIQLVGASLGLTPAELLSITADNGVMQSIAEIAVQLEAYRDAVRQYRLIITEGSIGDPTPAFPALPGYATPGGVPTGLFERLDDYVKRIRAAPAYTDEIGALLGIIPSKPTPIAPEDLQPTLKALALPGSVVQVSFVRGATDGVVLETKIDNAAEWTDAGRFFKSPAELMIPQNVQNLPRSVQVRARYVDGDTPVGQLSSVVSTATQSEG